MHHTRRTGNTERGIRRRAAAGILAAAVLLTALPACSTSLPEIIAEAAQEEIVTEPVQEETASETAETSAGATDGAAVAETAEAPSGAATAEVSAGAASADTSEAAAAAEAATAGASAGASAAESAVERAAAETAAAEHSDSDIYVHLASAPGDPVPCRTMDTDTASLLKQISEGLTVLDENGEPAPGCAEEWEKSDGGRRWTFFLRKDLCWADGTSMTASDFADLFVRIADPATEALYGQDLVRNIVGYEDVLQGDTKALDVTAPDDHTLIVNLTEPDPDFARVCASWALLPVRDRTSGDAAQPDTDQSDADRPDAEQEDAAQPDAEQEDADQPDSNRSDAEQEDANRPDAGSGSDWEMVTGNGPYYIEACKEGQEYVLKKNPFYAGDGNESGDESGNERAVTPFETVHWIVSGDVNEEYSGFLNGQMDAISTLPAEEEADLTLLQMEKEDRDSEADGSEKTEAAAEADRPGSAQEAADDGKAGITGPAETEVFYRVQNIPDVLGIFFNCRHEALQDTHVRRALSLAADRTYIASELLDNVYTPEAGQTAPDEALLGDTQEAEDQLAKAGYREGKDFPALTLAVDENGAAPLIAEYLAAVWKDLGIEVEVRALAADALAEAKTSGTFDLYCGNIWLASDLPAAELARFTSDDPANISGFSDEDYDSLIGKASTASSVESYEKTLQQAAEILEEKLPAAPLAARRISWLTSEQGAGIFCDASGCWQLCSAAEDRTDTAEQTVSGETAGAKDEDPAQMPADKADRLRADAAFPEQAAPEIDVPEVIAAAFSGQKPVPDSMTGLERMQASDMYFEQADQTAWLTRQAWVMDDVGEAGEPARSLPKYTEVHLTGTGRHYVRIEEAGRFYYLDAARVTPDRAVTEKVRAEEEEEDLQRDLVTASMHEVKETELADRAEELHEQTEQVLAEIARHEMIKTQTRNLNWDGPVLARSRGSVMGPSGKETYYNLNMSGVVSIMRRMGNTDEYWVRDDGCKMLGDYIMCAANLRVHPRGSLVECSLGTCIVCDTGGFASHNANQLDIAVTW